MLEVELDRPGNVVAEADVYSSSIDKVFACGDMRRGKSLVIWANGEDRQRARFVDQSPDASAGSG